MRKINTQLLRDLSTWLNFPSLRNQLHNSLSAGLSTLLDYQRLSFLLAAVKATKALPGDIIEFGTFQGGSAGVILQSLDSSKTLHVCDSFEGTPLVSTQ